ncbi:MAG TPA: CsgG/HfaB family protein, partial [Thermodesulfovibrionales bacterium]|nr:CsgG/HfaB family protein [Thermodesulfovibrionales bacterium]
YIDFPVHAAEIGGTDVLDSKINWLVANILKGVQERNRVAVTHFISSNGSSTEIASILHKEFLRALAKSNRVFIVEEGLLDKSLNELDIKESELLDMTHAEEIGRLTGADFIFYGTIENLEKQFMVEVHRIDTETGVVDRTISINFDSEEHHREEKELHKYFIRIYNIDDEGTAFVNDVPVRKVGYRGDSGWVDITHQLDSDKNIVRFSLFNRLSGWTYGFQLKKDDAIIWQDQCGKAGVIGCRNNDRTIGIVFNKSIEVNY